MTPEQGMQEKVLQDASRSAQFRMPGNQFNLNNYDVGLPIF